MSRPPRTGLGYQSTRVEFTGAVSGLGSGAVAMVQLSAYARDNSDERPYGVVNDYISTKLGAAIGAPVPPGELVKLGPEKWGFVSLGFGEDGRTPPPADLERLAEDRPWDATGILVLDHWVLNPDRHDENVAYMPPLGVAAFDFDHALFGPNPGADPSRTLDTGLAMTLQGHPFAQYLRTVEHLEYWCRRVGSIGVEEIRRFVWACKDAHLLSEAESLALIRFLRHRQGRIRGYIEENRNEFSRVASWPFSDAEVES